MNGRVMSGPGTVRWHVSGLGGSTSRQASGRLCSVPSKSGTDRIRHRQSHMVTLAPSVPRLSPPSVCQFLRFVSLR